MTNDAPSVLIWDETGEPPTWGGLIVLWREFPRKLEERIFSLPELIDKRAADFRRRFLEFVHQLGTTRLGGKTVIDHLELRDGLSYWWMTLPAQKDVYASSPYIYDVLKLFALEDLFRKCRPGKVRLVSRNHRIAEVLGAWCAGISSEFSWEQPPTNASSTRSSATKQLHRRLPMAMRGWLAFLAFVFERWLIRAAPVQPERPTDVIVFDIFTHFDAARASQGEFKSGYWTKLADHFDEAGIAVQWLHWFYAHRAVPRIRDACELIHRLTRSAPSPHQLVDFPLSLTTVCRVVRDYFRINRARCAMGQVADAFRPPGSRLDLWPLFYEDWLNSFTGPRAILSLFHLNLIEARIDKLPRQKLGLYIQENQPWEMALTHAWRARGHGPIVGVAHTTVPFWDLRYVFAPETFAAREGCAPLPDVMVLNGPDALMKIRDAGYPPELCRELEALRYLALESAADRRGRMPAGTASSTPRKLRLLILGDLLPQYTELQLDYLENCPPLPGLQLELVFRPHPASTSLPTRIAALGCVLSQGTLAEELQVCDAVFVGSATSAAADAYQVGVPVISLNDGEKINFSPLYGLPGVAFVHSAQELAQGLSSLDGSRRTDWPLLFTIDSRIPRWEKLVSDALEDNA